MLELPILRPQIIKTKNVPYITALWRWVTSIRKWEVVEDWEYILPDHTKVIIPEGFIFDGASIPKPFWAILSPVGLLLTPGLIHDYAYQHDQLLSLDGKGNRTVYKRKAGRGYWDHLFRDVAIDVNGFRIINYIAWLALILFGWLAWNAKRKSQVNPI
jgi:hypothetical protein